MWIVVITIILSNLPAHNCSQLWFRLIFIWRPLKSGKTAFNLHAIGKGLFKNNAHFSNDSWFVEGCKKNVDTTKGLIIYAYFVSSPFLCYSWQHCDNNVIDQMWGESVTSYNQTKTWCSAFIFPHSYIIPGTFQLHLREAQNFNITFHISLLLREAFKKMS